MRNALSHGELGSITQPIRAVTSAIRGVQRTRKAEVLAVVTWDSRPGRSLTQARFRAYLARERNLVPGMCQCSRYITVM